jgi:pantoate kinase
MNHQQLAFAPGHISGFFEPVLYNHDTNRTGSRGSGLSIALGATSTVVISMGQKQHISTKINNKAMAMPVTTLALQKLVGTTPLYIQVNTQLDLPTGQGFGMSAAGALSASLALADLMDHSPADALEAAHFAEVSLKTGLGDVIASSFGGIEIRKEAGLPPWGLIEHIPGSYQVVLCIIDRQVKTEKILTNPVRMKRIQKYGNICTKRILEGPSLENLFALSRWFAQQTGLLTPKIQSALDAVKDVGHASQCMLGNSIFAIGDTKQLIQRLSGFGRVYISAIDTQGARIL